MTQDKIEFAANVHYGFLPDRFSNDMLDVAVKARPWKGIGGDYCSVFPVDDSHLVLCFCDAVGHGLASALFAARINTFILSHMRCLVHLVLVNKVKLTFIQLLATDSQPCSGLMSENR